MSPCSSSYKMWRLLSGIANNFNFMKKVSLQKLVFSAFLRPILLAFTTHDSWKICNWSRLHKVPVNENQTRLLFQVISHLCVSVKRIPWALHSTFTSLRMNSSPTQSSPNRLHMSPYFISSPNFTVRHEVSARPGWPLQLRRSRDLQVCGFCHRLAPWEEFNRQTGA